MMLEPDENSSPGAQNPNSSLDHRTTSPASLDMCTAQIAAAARYSSTKSLFDTASIEFALTEAKPSSRATVSRSSSQFRPARAPDPSGSSPAPSRASAN